MFFSISQYNYSREILYYRQLLSDAYNPELQRAILAARLVNQTSNDDSQKPIDLSLEYLNNGIKNGVKYYKNSTYDRDIILDRIYRTNTFVGKVSTVLEKYFSEYISDSYTTISIRLDIYTRATTLVNDSLSRPRKQYNRRRGTVYYDSIDIRASIAELLARVDKYNTRLYRYNVDNGGIDLFVEPTSGIIAPTSFIDSTNLDNQDETIIAEVIDIIYTGQRLKRILPLPNDY